MNLGCFGVKGKEFTLFGSKLFNTIEKFGLSLSEKERNLACLGVNWYVML